MRPGTRAVVRYNAARLGVLAALLLIGYLVGLQGMVLVVSALLASAVVSWFLLARLRADMIAAVQQSTGGWRSRQAAREAREDDYDERLRSGGSDSPAAQ